MSIYYRVKKLQTAFENQYKPSYYPEPTIGDKMTKQIKTYYAQGPYISETKDNILFTDKPTEVMLKSDHDEIVNALKSKHEIDLSELAAEKNKVKKLVDALKFYASKRHPIYQQVATQVLKEIGEL